MSVNEGEGDFLLVGDRILAGTGFRSDAESHDELRKLFGREVVTLELVVVVSAVAVMPGSPACSTSRHRRP